MSGGPGRSHLAFQFGGVIHVISGKRFLRLVCKVAAIGALCLALPVSAAGQINVTSGFIQHNLVSDLPSMSITTEPKLKNPWGVAFGSTATMGPRMTGSQPPLRTSNSLMSTTRHSGLRTSSSFPLARHMHLTSVARIGHRFHWNLLTINSNPGRYLAERHSGVRAESQVAGFGAVLIHRSGSRP